jgi:hypothetical protein
MDEATFDRETARNRAAYETLREQIRREHAGQYVALGEGRILASSADYDEVKAAVQRLRPVPEYYLIFPADMEPPFEPYYSYYSDPYLPS